MRRGLSLTSTDIALLRWLWMLRVMTLRQLRRVGYYQQDSGQLSSWHNVRKRLQRLWKEGYLEGDTLLNTRERIYSLGGRALEPLREHCGVGQRRLYRPRRQDTLRQIHHPLLVSECAVRLEESLRGSSAKLVEIAPLSLPFYHTHAIGNPAKRKHVERFVTQEDIAVPGRPDPLRIRPDLVCALASGKARRLFFLEADRGFESPEQIEAKLKAYHHYASARAVRDPQRFRWQRYGDFTDFRVLLVTTSTQRIEQLCRHLTGRPGFELAAFAATTAVKKENIVSGAIWRVPSGGYRALLGGGHE